MFRTSLLIAFCAFFTISTFGQDDAQYQAWMKSMGPDLAALRMAITAQDNRAVTAAADKISATFKDVLGFWQKKNAADAVTFATTAREVANAIGYSMSTEDQNTNLAKLQQQCAGCHMAHRGGTAPDFTIK